MTQLQQQYHDARTGKHDTVVIEGVHAFKHALRFGATFLDIATHTITDTAHLIQSIAGQKETNFFMQHARELSPDEYNILSTHPPHTGLIALAKKPTRTATHTNNDTKHTNELCIFLENPRSLHNVGAVIRVAAARAVQSVIISGTQNPWHAECIRTAAGLHFAIQNVAHLSLDDILKLAKEEKRPLITLDANGESIYHADIAKNAIICFGTERSGLSDTLKNSSDMMLSLPMQTGVSSLNLATSVAATLYAHRSWTI